MYQTLLWLACLARCVVSHSKSKSKSKDGADQLTLENVRELDKELTGTCFTPEDGQMYDAASLGQWIYGKPPLNKPFTLVEVASLCDVSRVLKFARDTKAPFRIRSGGHSYSGHSTCAGNCIVMDVSTMKQATFDASRNLWLFGAGASLRELASAGAFPHGVCGDIGIGGHVQGGGMGILASKLGYTTDHMVGAWVMLSNGDIIHATKTNEYSDLLWAMRGGGGGNWGVLLLMEFKPQFDLANDYVYHVVGIPYFITDPANYKLILKTGIHDYEAPLLNRQQLDPTYDYTGSFYIRATTESFYSTETPVYYLVNSVVWMRGKDDVAAETRYGNWINSCATPSAYHSGVNMTDSRLMYNFVRFPLCDQGFPKQAPFIARTRLAFTSLEQNDAFLDAMTTFFMKWRLEKSAFLYFIFFPIGASSKFHDPDTSYFRGALHSVDLYAMARSAAGIPAAQGMVADFESMIAPTLGTRQYMNEFSPDDVLTDPAAANIVTRLYGSANDATYKKLRDIKAKYDKKNFFQFPGSVEPSSKKVKEYHKMDDPNELRLLGSVLNITGCPRYKDLDKKVKKAQAAAALVTSGSGSSGTSAATVSTIIIAVLGSIVGVCTLGVLGWLIWKCCTMKKLRAQFGTHTERMSQQADGRSTVVEADDNEFNF